MDKCSLPVMDSCCGNVRVCCKKSICCAVEGGRHTRRPKDSFSCFGFLGDLGASLFAALSKYVLAHQVLHAFFMQGSLYEVDLQFQYFG